MTIVSARSLGVPAWTYAGLEDTSTCIVWREWSLATDLAEAQARRTLMDRPTGGKTKRR